MIPLLDTRAAADELLVAARAPGQGDRPPRRRLRRLGARVVRREGDRARWKVQRGDRRAGDVWPPAPSAARSRPSISPGPRTACRWWSRRRCASSTACRPRSALLQEMPDPLTSISWSGWVELHPTTASALGVVEGDVVGLEGPPATPSCPPTSPSAFRAGVVAVPVGYASPLLDRTRARARLRDARAAAQDRARRFAAPRPRGSIAAWRRARARGQRPRGGCPWRPPCLPSFHPSSTRFTAGGWPSISIAATAAAPAWPPATSRTTSRSSAPRRSQRDAT